jgi:hypothetical protein
MVCAARDTEQAREVSEMSQEMNGQPVFHYTAEQLIEQYIALRDAVKKIAERHAAELEPYKAGMDAIAGEAARMMRHMKTTLSTPAGTCFWMPHESFKVEDQELFRNWVIDRNEWRMTTAHVSKDGIRAWRDEQQRPLDWPADVEWNPPIPPGLSYDFEMRVQFRKG